MKVDSFVLKKYLIPLGQKDFVLYCFKRILYNLETDSTILKNNTYSELMTLKTVSNFKPYNSTTKDFSDSADLAADIPGYAVPLNALLKLKSVNRNVDNSRFLNKLLFTAYSFFDEVDTIKQLMYGQYTFQGNNIKNRSVDSVLVDNQLAIPKILKEAESHKVIMINESHYDWRHRYFMTLLLDSLFKKGYKYLCMEDLENEEAINKRKFPMSDDGYYIKEPFMANLARTALHIGYKLIEYEDTTNDIDAYLFNSPVDKREYYQALNLYRQYKKDTISKWIVYAGYSHINKLRFSLDESSTMAKYFSEFSHVDPYSINQTTYCDIFNTKVAFDSSQNRGNYYYLRKNQINDSTLLKQSDLYIINNIHNIPYEKPDTSKSDQEYHIGYNRKKNEIASYVEVFLKNEYFQNHHAVPIYIKSFSGNILNKNVWLPKNNYYMIVRDESDKIIFQSDLRQF